MSGPVHANSIASFSFSAMKGPISIYQTDLPELISRAGSRLISPRAADLTWPGSPRRSPPLSVCRRLTTLDGSLTPPSNQTDTCCTLEQAKPPRIKMNK
ncbi:hypothetical protein DPEC_G00005200 [Dallia pectoralis]|uniref:Uncharacterized protein n=1 Tax=Dallia pectoralis TaxID=75939 RepID=A0ACC2HKG9_DALPE|nr:hypothetical protein DPEC_G00005200 [Dallia pectoralis]